MEQWTNQTEQFLAKLVSGELFLQYGLSIAKLVVVALIVMISRKLLISAIDSVLKNRITQMVAKSEHFDGIEQKRLDTLGKLAKSIITYSIYFIGIITILDMVGIKITTVLAGAGILSLAVAFGAQSIVKDLMSGLFIILENQYAVGEYVRIEGEVGKVTEIGMKSTKIVTTNGEVIIFPNGNIGQLVNYSREPQRGFVEVGIAYEENIDHAIQVITAACQQMNHQYGDQLSEQASVLGVSALADSSVVIRTTFTVNDWKQYIMERHLRKMIKEHLDQQGVEISYPKLVLMPTDHDETI